MGSACVFHSQGTVGSLREGQDQFRWDSSSKPPQLLSICCTMDTVFSTCKQLCSFNLLTTREMRRTYTHFKARNTEAQPGLSNLLKILWLTNGTGGLRMWTKDSSPHSWPLCSFHQPTAATVNPLLCYFQLWARLTGEVRDDPPHMGAFQPPV